MCGHSLEPRPPGWDQDGLTKKSKGLHRSWWAQSRLLSLSRRVFALVVVIATILFAINSANRGDPVIQQQNQSPQQPQEPSLEHCRRHYLTINNSSSPARLPGDKVNTKDDEGIPPLLLSYPGSGNTFLRAVLEYATSLVSGSVYLSDKELNGIFQGEQICGRDCGLIKGHPTDFSIMVEVDIWNKPIKGKKGDKRERLRLLSRHMRHKCVKGNIRYWTRIILLVRDPFAAILSDFQRFVSNSHTGGVTSLDEKLKDEGTKTVREAWLDRSMITAKEFSASFSRVMLPILRAKGNGSGGKYPDLGVSAPYPYIVRFESIVANSNKEERVDELERLIKAVYPNLEPGQPSRDKLRCAFVLADAKEGITRSASKKLTLKQVYVDADPKLSCQMWKHVEGFAGNFSYNAAPGLQKVTMEALCAGRSSSPT